VNTMAKTKRKSSNSMIGDRFTGKEKKFTGGR
jgi:hypothetical protein